MMTNGDPEGQIFLSYPHTNNGFFFLFKSVLFIYLFKKYIRAHSDLLLNISLTGGQSLK